MSCSNAIVRRTARFQACLFIGLYCVGIGCTAGWWNVRLAAARVIDSDGLLAFTVDEVRGGVVPAGKAAEEEQLDRTSAGTTEPANTLNYEKISLPDIENAFRVGSRFISGGQPDSKASFAALKKLGVTTAISVDGSVPNITEARAAGIQYVHIPIGYDTVSPEHAVQFAVAVQRAKGKVFFHCHHGKHRGPAALAAVMTATGVCSKSSAINWMKQAGTAAEYAGLYAAIDRQTPISADEIANFKGDLPEVADVPGTVSAMVSIDILSDDFKAWEATALTRTRAEKSQGQPAASEKENFDPQANATLLREQFQELVRHPESIARGDDYLKLMRAAETAAIELSQSIPSDADALKWSDDERNAVGRRLKAVAASCKSCHERFRNNVLSDDAAGDAAAGDAAARDGAARDGAAGVQSQKPGG